MLCLYSCVVYVCNYILYILLCFFRFSSRFVRGRFVDCASLYVSVVIVWMDVFVCLM